MLNRVPLCLMLVIGAWGPCEACPVDIDGDGRIGFRDLLIILGGWGACP